MSFRIDELVPMLHDLHNNKFYGSIEIIYKDGEIQFLKKVETVKPAAITVVALEINTRTT